MFAGARVEEDFEGERDRDLVGFGWQRQSMVLEQVFGELDLPSIV